MVLVMVWGREQNGEIMIETTAQQQFPGRSGYLNTAAAGLPATATLEAVRHALADWEAGRCDPVSFDVPVGRARRAHAEITGTGEQAVAIVSQVSVASGLVASSLPDGARVLCAEEEFTSLLFPFLVDQRLDVQTVPLDHLLDHVTEATDLVAVSAAQSADGRVIDLDTLADVARATGTRTYVDLSQAAGWLPIGADRFDVTASGAYKWLCAPRGSGFITVGDHADWLVPRYAGWYAGADPWEALYGPPLRLADDARRFDASPAWFDMVGAAPALEVIAGIGVEAIHDHSVGLANRFRDLVGLPASNSAIVSVETERGSDLARAGIKAATRAGRVRLSFYLYNTIEDVERAAAVLTGATTRVD
jgi:selenocysteine lyase/cysteine desulfurase